MDRDHPNYRKYKLAFTLQQTEEWKDYLKPLIEDLIPKSLPRAREGLPACFEIADKQGQEAALKAVLTAVEMDAKVLLENPNRQG